MNMDEDFWERTGNRMLVNGLVFIVGAIVGGGIVSLTTQPINYKIGDFNNDGIRDIRYELLVGDKITLYGSKDQNGIETYSLKPN